MRIHSIETVCSGIKAWGRQGKKHFLRGNDAMCHVTGFVMVWISVLSVISIVAIKRGTPKAVMKRVPTQIMLVRAGKSKQLCLNCQIIH